MGTKRDSSVGWALGFGVVLCALALGCDDAPGEIDIVAERPLCDGRCSGLGPKRRVEAVDHGPEDLVARVGDRHDVLDADPEAARDIDPRLVGHRHARGEDLGGSADQVGMLVDLEADAMPQPMGKALVVGPEARSLDDGPGG